MKHSFWAKKVFVEGHIRQMKEDPASLKRQNKKHERRNVNKEKMRRERRKEQVFYAPQRK